MSMRPDPPTASPRTVVLTAVLAAAALAVVGPALLPSGSTGPPPGPVAPVLAQPIATATEPIARIVNVFGGAVASVVITGNVAYSAAGAQLNALPLDDPSRPVAVDWTGCILAHPVSGGLAYGEAVYFAGLDGLVWADTSAPAALRCGTVGVSGGLPGPLARAGNYLYVTRNYPDPLMTLIHIVDVADPVNPVAVGGFGEAGSFYEVRSLAVGAGHLYVAGWSGLAIFSLTDPLHPVAVGTVRPFGAALAMTADDRALYVLTPDYATVEVVLSVYSLVDPTRLESPTVFRFPTATDRMDGLLSLDGDNLAVFVGGPGHSAQPGGTLRILDVSDIPGAGYVQRASLPVDQAVEQMSLRGDRIALAMRENGIRFLTGVSSGSLVEGTTVPTFVPSDVAMDASFGYVVGGSDALGLIAFPHTGDQAPGTAYGLSLPGGARRLALTGDRIYALGDRLHVIDVAWGRPELVGSLPVTATWLAAGPPGTVVLTGPVVGLAVVDASDPGQPRLAGSLNGEGWTLGQPAVRGTTVFVPDGQMGVRAISIADPAHPVEVGQLPLAAPRPNSYAALVGNTLYLSGVSGARTYARETDRRRAEADPRWAPAPIATAPPRRATQVLLVDVSQPDRMRLGGSWDFEDYEAMVGPIAPLGRSALAAFNYWSGDYLASVKLGREAAIGDIPLPGSGVGGLAAVSTSATGEFVLLVANGDAGLVEYRGALSTEAGPERAYLPAGDTGVNRPR